MIPIPKLDLIGVAWPVCLLKFKTAVNDLVAYQVIDVLTKDPDVAASIKLIIERSADTLINQEREGDVYRISIQKGSSLQKIMVPSQSMLQQRIL